MIDTKKLLALILKKLKPATLYNTRLSAPTTQSEYAYASVPGLADYDVVIMRCECNNVRQLLVFCLLFGDSPLHISDNAGTYIRGGYIVEWSTNRIGVRWVNGSNTNVFAQQVYGIL